MRRRLRLCCGALVLATGVHGGDQVAQTSALRLAVLPIDNRTGRAAPLDAVERLLVESRGEAEPPDLGVRDPAHGEALKRVRGRLEAIRSLLSRDHRGRAP